MEELIKYYDEVIERIISVFQNNTLDAKKQLGFDRFIELFEKLKKEAINKPNPQKVDLKEIKTELKNSLFQELNIKGINDKTKRLKVAGIVWHILDYYEDPNTKEAIKETLDDLGMSFADYLIAGVELVEEMLEAKKEDKHKKRS